MCGVEQQKTKNLIHTASEDWDNIKLHIYVNLTKTNQVVLKKHGGIGIDFYHVLSGGS